MTDAQLQLIMNGLISMSSDAKVAFIWYLICNCFATPIGFIVVFLIIASVFRHIASKVTEFNIAELNRGQ